MRGSHAPRRGRREADPGAARGLARLARRTQIRRRRAALVAIAAGIALLGVALLGGESRGHRHPPSRAIATPARGSRSSGGHAPSGAGAGGVSQAGSGESAEVRRLIALGKPIYCAARRGDEVALTFDDGPGPYTRLVMAKLRKHGVRATFFIVGRNISLLPGATRRERALGAVGDHTFSHPQLTALAPGKAQREIVDTQAALARSSGGPVFLFRPPYGAHDARVDRIAREHGLLQILWTVDSADSLGASYAAIERNVIAGLRGGAIILMHENHGQTVRALLGIFAALKRKHLRAVSVPQLLSDDPPSLAQVRARGGACGVRSGSALGGG
jgi:peptidoglycan/xylan/chitin deacetylase (PgdA/CDA1 family)